MKTLTALLISLALCGCASTSGTQREIQAAIDASIGADRRRDLAARLELMTPDFEVVTLDGRVLRRAEVERGIEDFKSRRSPSAPRRERPSRRSR